MGRTGGGGGWFSRGSSSSSSRGGWFSRSSSSSRSSSVSKPSSTYPKQQWGSSGTRTNSIGSGTRTNSIGGGGFVNPRNSFKTNPYGTNQDQLLVGSTHLGDRSMVTELQDMEQSGA